MFGKAKEKAQKVVETGRKVADTARTAKDVGAMLLTRGGGTVLKGGDGKCRCGRDLNKIMAGKIASKPCCLTKLEAIFSKDDD